jgi:hypothetical protein
LVANDVGLLGDQVDLNTGTLSFEHVDVSLPGNSNLPVEVRRRRVPRRRSGYYYYSIRGFQDWEISIP